MKKAEKVQKTERQTETQVGKNQVSIPTLQIPSRSDNNKVII